MSAHSFKQSQAQINHQPTLKPFSYIPDSPTAKPEKTGEQDFIKLSLNKQSSTKSDVDNSANSNLITNEKNTLPFALHNKFPMVSNFTINHNVEKYEYEKPVKPPQQSTKTYCQFCNTRKPTQIQLKNGSNTYILACILFVLCLPLFWVPLISKKCKDSIEICVVCNRQTRFTPFRLF